MVVSALLREGWAVMEHQTHIDKSAETGLYYAWCSRCPWRSRHWRFEIAAYEAGLFHETQMEMKKPMAPAKGGL